MHLCPVRRQFACHLHHSAARPRPVSEIPDEILPAEAGLALAWSPQALRGPLSTFLQLDRRLARIVTRTSEPMLGQMRLAWWREMLGKPVGERPLGDVVLDGLGTHWAGREDALVRVVDGWEYLLPGGSLEPDDLGRCAAGRAAPFAALLPATDEMLAARIAMAGRRYLLADIAANLSGREEREAAIAQGLGGTCPDLPLPSALRGLGVLEALALRALKRGGRPLMEGRGASIVALKVAILGR